ncbi:MAG: hypothetical protein LBQ15_05825 [Clostridium sp.]|jgi:hypothetical protein|nr:hypothetical protein [Clostridium sp.]
MQTKTGYLKMDAYRLWHSKRILAGTLLTYAALMFNSFLWGRSLDVLLLYFGIRTFSTFVLVYLGCTVPFAASLAEDLEHKFLLPQLIRGSVPRYVCSKVLLTFGSSVLCMAGGTLLFVGTYRFRYPLCDPTTGIFDYYLQADFVGGLLETGHYAAYFVASACFTGMLGGLLALLSMCLSLFVRNKLLVVSFPMIGHYFMDNYVLNWLRLPHWCSPVYIFSSEVGAWGKSPASMLYAGLVSLLGMALCAAFLTRKLRKEG